MRETARQPAPAEGPAERVDLPITGMMCAACARRIERRLTHAPGVRQAHVNFATARATVEYDPRRTDVPALVEAVRAGGHGAAHIAEGAGAEALAERAEAAERAERRALWRRFLVAAVLSGPVLLIAMAHGRV